MKLEKFSNRNLTNSRSIEMPMTIIIQQEEMKVCKSFSSSVNRIFFEVKKFFFPLSLGVAQEKLNFEFVLTWYPILTAVLMKRGGR